MIVSIDGNIGVGKTSVMQALETRYGYTCVYQDVDSWTPYLEKFYECQSRWAVTINTMIVASIQHLVKKHYSPDKLIIIESGVGSVMAFTLAHYMNDTISHDEYKVVESVCDLMEPLPDHVLLLETDIPTLQRRIKERGRPFEQDIRPEYLSCLQDAFNRVYKDNCLKINAGENLESIVDKIHSMISKNDFRQ